MLKAAVLFYILIFSTLMGNTQNLVPNPSFEEYTICPDGISQIKRASEWSGYRITPDYHNACNTNSVVSVPYSLAGGFQEAKQGVAYVGYHQYSSNGHTEALGVELTSPLEVGHEYYISYYVNRSKHYGGIAIAGNCWSNGQGDRFSMTPYTNDSPENEVPTDNLSHLFNADLISDTLNWVHLISTFIADSAYSYMSIGNFYEQQYLNYECDLDYNVFTAYYFVDCVCVTEDATDCDLLLSSRENLMEDIRIYPNPFDSELIIDSPFNERISFCALYS
jgi:hypothetical protein